MRVSCEFVVMFIFVFIELFGLSNFIYWLLFECLIFYLNLFLFVFLKVECLENFILKIVFFVDDMEILDNWI